MKPGERDIDDDYRQHEITYKWFVRGVVLFTAHVAVVLILLAIFLL